MYSFRNCMNVKMRLIESIFSPQNYFAIFNDDLSPEGNTQRISLPMKIIFPGGGGWTALSRKKYRPKQTRAYGIPSHQRSRRGGEKLAEKSKTAKRRKAAATPTASAATSEGSAARVVGRRGSEGNGAMGIGTGFFVRPGGFRPKPTQREGPGGPKK